MDEPDEISEDNKEYKQTTVCGGLQDAEVQPNSYTDKQKESGECLIALTPDRVVYMQGEC